MSDVKLSPTEPGAISPVFEFGDTQWHVNDKPTSRTGAEAQLEQGGVLLFPKLAFALTPDEQRFLDPRWADPSSKNISIRGTEAKLKGALGSADEQAALQRMIVRYRDRAQALINYVLPHYRERIKQGNTSFRPMDVTRAPRSWRQDDARLHVDAFASNPMQGRRLLRVFSNVNPHGRDRVWRVGEPFAAFAARYAPSIKRPMPGAHWALHAFKVTKARRSLYDHWMLALHDLAKSDPHYQRHAPQQQILFAPGTTWVVFSDQVLHAAMGGQYMFEQTFMLNPEHQLDPQTAPSAQLKRLLGFSLV